MKAIKSQLSTDGLIKRTYWKLRKKHENAQIRFIDLCLHQHNEGDVIQANQCSIRGTRDENMKNKKQMKLFDKFSFDAYYSYITAIKVLEIKFMFDKIVISVNLLYSLSYGITKTTGYLFVLERHQLFRRNLAQFRITPSHPQLHIHPTSQKTLENINRE